ncbi:MAG: xanthine dehydrogenase family protein subunit M [Vicinamibacterales bacterium]
MISTPFDYQRAVSIDDALQKLGAGGGKLVAGGHSLVPVMKMRLSEPATLIDIARIPGLSGVRDQGSTIEIGAGTTHREVAASALLRERCPILAETAADIGDPQVRNRGTLGGSLAHADPAADYPATMLALDAELQLQSTRGSRTVKASSFFKDVFTVDLARDEMIVSVRFTPVRAAAYAKLHQRASHFAIVGVAAAVQASGGVITSALVGLTGAGSHATRLAAVEKALEGQPATPAGVQAAAALATLEEVNADIHASASYRRAMIPVFTRRALEAAIGRL